MCLIITGQSNKIRTTLLNTNGLLSDIHTSNPDGIGIMYATSKGLKITKTLPKNYADALAFIGKLPQDDRELAIHFRWTTHGHTDMENCHPYNVVNGYVAMMHNGVLHTGNAADKSKSDTWHFIKDYLTGPVSEHPPLVHNAGFLTMLADFIGDNRFVFMDGDGRMSHVNYDQGVEHDGMWFSNTYAWVPSKLIPNYYQSTKKAYKSYVNGYDYDYDDEFGYGAWDYETKSWKDATTALTPLTPLPDDDTYDMEFDVTFDSLSNTLAYCDVDTLSEMMDFQPSETLDCLFKWFEPKMNKYCREDRLTAREEDILAMVLSGDIKALEDMSHMSTVAEVICYYFDWHVRPVQVVA